MEKKSFTIHGGHFRTAAQLIVILGNTVDTDGEVLKSYGIKSDALYRRYQEYVKQHSGDLIDHVLFLNTTVEALEPDSGWNGPKYMAICFVLNGCDGEQHQICKVSALSAALSALYQTLRNENTQELTLRPFFYMDLKDVVGVTPIALYTTINAVHYSSFLDEADRRAPEVCIRVSERPLEPQRKCWND